MSRNMAEEPFAAYPTGSLVANVKEVWMYTWTDLLSTDVFARFSALETLVIVADGNLWSLRSTTTRPLWPPISSAKSESWDKRRCALR